MPNPVTYASRSNYLALLERTCGSIMISWFLVSEESDAYTNLADVIQLTLSAVTISEENDPLISWPRIQNQLLPDRPYTPLPNWDLFDSIITDCASVSTFYFDVANMFHDIILPEAVLQLFPMPKLNLHELPDSLSVYLCKTFAGCIAPRPIFRPCQASMPMGFKWSVFFSHNLASKLLQESFHIFTQFLLVPSSASSFISSMWPLLFPDWT